MLRRTRHRAGLWLGCLLPCAGLVVGSVAARAAGIVNPDFACTGASVELVQCKGDITAAATANLIKMNFTGQMTKMSFILTDVVGIKAAETISDSSAPRPWSWDLTLAVAPLADHDTLKLSLVFQHGLFPNDFVHINVGDPYKTIFDIDTSKAEFKAGDVNKVPRPIDKEDHSSPPAKPDDVDRYFDELLAFTLDANRHITSWSYQIDAVHVAEPGTLALFGIGLASLGLMQRLRPASGPAVRRQLDQISETGMPGPSPRHDVE